MPLLDVGARVEAKWRQAAGGTTWYPGVVLQVGEHRSSTASEPVFMYDVRFDAEGGESADEEEGIPQLFVRALRTRHAPVHLGVSDPEGAAPVEVSAAEREERHDTLVSMGFDSALVMQALHESSWDVEAAANVLAESVTS